MESFGPTFKILREEKGYKLKEIAHGIISVPTLSNFENGHADIKLSNFTMLLNRINISYDEFMFKHKDPFISDINKIIYEFSMLNGNNFDKYALLKGSTKYQKLYEMFGNEMYLHAAILFELYSVHAEHLDQSKKQIIINYLERIEVWGKYEFFLFHCFSFIFTTEDLISISPFFIKQAQNFPISFDVNINELLLNQALVFIMHESIDEAEKIMDEFDKVFISMDVTAISFPLLAGYIRGLIKIARGNDEGEKECDRYLEILGGLPSYVETRNQLYYWIGRCKSIADKR